MCGDVWTGYKVFKKKVLEGISLEASRFEMELELTMKVAQKKMAGDGSTDFLHTQK
jgi:hypothetical protein